MVVALPTTTGKADWTNYTDYWREEDAEWLQERTILKYDNDVARTAQWPTPKAGQVTYNAANDQLELFTTFPTASPKWISILASQHLKITPITSTSNNDPVIISHRGAGGAGIQFNQTVSSEAKVAIVSPAYLDIGAGAIVAKSTGLTVTTTSNLATTKIKTGARTVTMTTDATSLVIDSPISPTMVSTGNISMTGGSTLTGGIINGASGSIGSVGLQEQYVSAPAGYVSQAGYFYGNTISALMSQRNPSTGAVGGCYVQTDVSNITLNGGSTYFHTQMRVMGNRGIAWHNSAGTHVAWGGIVIYSGSDPGAANFPDGTIWFSP